MQFFFLQFLFFFYGRYVHGNFSKIRRDLGDTKVREKQRSNARLHRQCESSDAGLTVDHVLLDYTSEDRQSGVCVLKREKE